MAKKVELKTKPAQPPVLVDPAPARRGPGRPKLEEPSAEFVARRQQIILEATRVFHEKGYDAATLDDVANALGLQRRSLYYYVGSKAKLLEMIFEQSLDLAIPDMERSVDVENPAESLEKFVRFFARAVCDQRSLFAVFYDERSRGHLEYKESLHTKERRFFEGCQQIVEAAGKAGILEVSNPVYATQAIMGMITWAYKWFHPDRDDAAAFAEQCVQLLLDGRGRTDIR